MNNGNKNEKIKQLYSFKNLQLGIILSFIQQPFEVVRTSTIINKYKNQTNINLKGTFFIIGMLLMIRQIQYQEGYRGFFRGSTLSIVKNILGFTTFFFNIDNLKKQLNTDRNHNYNFFDIRQYPQIILFNILNFSTAAISKTISNVICAPINVIKTRFEVVGDVNPKIHQAFQDIYKNEGFYKGLFFTILRDAPYQGIQYSLYQHLFNFYGFVTKDQIPQENVKLVFFLGGFSSAVAVGFTYPFDNVRTRCQYDKRKNINCFQFCQNIYISEGIKGFYQGYLPKLFKKIISGAVIWSVYENSKSNQGNL